MERIGTMIDGRIIIAITVDELKDFGKYTATDKEVINVFHSARESWKSTEIGQIINNKTLCGLYVKNVLYSHFTSEDIETHLSRFWAYPLPIFDFDGTIVSYLKLADRLIELPMIGPKKAKEIHQVIINALHDHSF